MVAGNRAAGPARPRGPGSAWRRASRAVGAIPEGVVTILRDVGPSGWGSSLVCGVTFGRPDAGGRTGSCGGRSGWSSRSAVRTGRLRRSPAVHARPIDLVVSQEPSQEIPAGSLVSEGASRLDAFSAYPVPTWLPGDAPSGTAGTPAVGPPQSSRTRGDAPQASYARGR